MPVDADEGTPGHNRLVIAAVLTVLAVPFVLFCSVLDRFPEPYIDESFWNYSAIRYLAGESFTWMVSREAPHWDLVWAYQPPYYPRLQVATHAILGVSYLACRLPNFLTANLAVAIIATHLVRHKLRWEGLILALAWIGDRAYLESLWGRPEGLALLFVVLGFLCLLRVVQSSGLTWIGLASAALAVAVGFHASAFYFWTAGAIVAFLRSPDDRRIRTVASVALGSLVPFALSLLLLWPNYGEGLEQFAWTTREAVFSTPISERYRWFHWTLFQSKGWVYGLAALAVLTLVLIARQARQYWRRAASGEYLSAVIICSGVYTLAALVTVLRGFRPFVYYLVLADIWPILSALALYRSPIASARTKRLLLAAFVLMAASWIPSLGQNALRLRAGLLSRQNTDLVAVARELDDTIPAGRKVVVGTNFFLIARLAHLDYEVVPFLGHLPPDFDDRWLVLQGTPDVARQYPERTLLYAGDAFHGRAKWAEFPYLILSEAK